MLLVYHCYRLFKLCNIVLLIIDVSGHVGEGFGDFVWREGEVSPPSGGMGG